jgi:RNA polymerase sigma-70 factor, ECF subfamily
MTKEDLAQLLPALLPRVWAFALRLTGNQHDAEDLVQNACLRGLERAEQLQPNTAPLSWMFAIIYSIAMNERRARRVRARPSSERGDDWLLNLEDPSGRTPEQNVMYGQMIDAVQQLPERQRDVLLLVGIEGLSYRDAAEVLKIPIGTVMSRLRRARTAIGKQFNGADGAGRFDTSRKAIPCGGSRKLE